MYLFIFYLYKGDWKGGNKIPSLQPTMAHYGPNLLPSNIPMQTLLFLFLLNNIPLKSISSLHWGSLLSFHFIPPPVLGSSLLYPSPGETQPILSTLFHSLLTSEPLSPSSPPVSALCIFLLLCFTCWRRCQVGVARMGGEGVCRQHLISYLRINHELLSMQSSSDPSASLSGSSGSLIPTRTHTQHWLIAVRAPVHTSTCFHFTTPSCCKICSVPPKSCTAQMQHFW